VKTSWLGRIQLVSGKCREDVARMDVLVSVMANVQVLDCLQQAPGYRHKPDRAIEIIEREQLRQWAVTTFSDDIERVRYSNASNTYVM